MINNLDDQIMVLAKIRELIPNGTKYMQNELVDIISTLVLVAKRYKNDHHELMNFKAGLGATEECPCNTCQMIRKLGI
jgi:hypothetical protein